MCSKKAFFVSCTWNCNLIASKKLARTHSKIKLPSPVHLQIVSITIMIRVRANGLRDQNSVLGWIIPKIPKWFQLHKIFKKNCVKLSYSCMPNINGIISRSNIAKLSKEKNKVIAKCNCRDKFRCPLEGKCKQERVVYKVEVYSDSNKKRNKKIYFGSTLGRF